MPKKLKKRWFTVSETRKGRKIYTPFMKKSTATADCKLSRENKVKCRVVKRTTIGLNKSKFGNYYTKK